MIIWRLHVAALVLTGVGVTQNEVAFVEVVSATSTVREQPVEVTVRFGLDRQFFASQAVPLLQRPVDLPVQLLVPWLEGEQPWAELVGGDEGPRLALGDRTAAVRALPPGERDGRQFDRYQLRLRWLAPEAGDHRLGPVRLRYAYTTRFEETLLSGRQPVDRHEAEVESSAVTIAVRDLPAGAPEGFAGAVGEFEVGARVDVESVEVGDSFGLELRVSGTGNLTSFAAPPWPALEGFAVQGLAERQEPGVRRFVFDVVALREGAKLPALSFVFFRPSAMQYSAVVAESTPLQVVARSGDRPLSPRLQRLIGDRGGGGLDSRVWWGALVAAAIVLAGLLTWLVRRRHRA